MQFIQTLHIYTNVYKIIQFVQTLHVYTNVYKFAQMWIVLNLHACRMIVVYNDWNGFWSEDNRVCRFSYEGFEEEEGKFLWDILIIEGR